MHAHVHVVRLDHHAALRLRRDAVRVEPSLRGLRRGHTGFPARSLNRRGCHRGLIVRLGVVILAPFSDGVVRRRLGGTAAERVVRALVRGAALGARHLLGRDAREVRVVDGVVLFVNRRHHRVGSTLVQPHLELLHDLAHLVLEVGDRLGVPFHLRALDEPANVLLLRREILRQAASLLLPFTEHLLDVLGGVPVVTRGFDVSLGGGDIPELREPNAVLLELVSPRAKLRLGDVRVGNLGNHKRSLVDAVPQQQPLVRPLTATPVRVLVLLQVVRLVRTLGDADDLAQRVLVLAGVSVNSDADADVAPGRARVDEGLGDPLRQRVPREDDGPDLDLGRGNPVAAALFVVVVRVIIFGIRGCSSRSRGSFLLCW